MADYDYGLDSELRRKRESSYDKGLEDEVRKWIGNVAGKPLQGDFFDALKDGVILCELVNKIKPGSVRKINRMKMPFMQMENISAFLEAARALGVPQPDLFMTVDLFERKNPNQVVQTLVSLGRASQKVAGYSGPSIGAKLSDKREVEFSEDQLRKGAAVGSRQTTGYTGGASQKGMTFGQRREIGGKDPYK